VPILSAANVPIPDNVIGKVGMVAILQRVRPEDDGKWVAVRNWLDSRGYEAMAAKIGKWLDGSLSDQQRADLFVADLVRNAREYVAGKRDGKPGAVQGTMLASTLAEDIAKQEKWLTTEARARGYKDIDDLVDRNYALFEKLALLWRQKNPAENGVLLSRGATTKAAYERQIDALFNSGKASLVGVKVLDRTELLGLLGHADKAVYLAEGKVMAGMANHPQITAEVWKKVPEWLDRPAAVFKSDTVGNRLVFIAPEQVAGSMVLLVVEPDGQQSKNGHLMLNAYDKDNGNPPVARWIADGLLMYADQKVFPAILTASRLQLPGTALQNKPGTLRILTEKHLSGYIKAHPETGFSRAGNIAPQGTAAERADKLIQTNAATAKPLDAIARTLTRVTGVERLTGAIYNRTAYLLDRLTAYSGQ